MRNFNHLVKLQSFTDAEIVELSKPVNHKFYVHQRRTFMQLGLYVMFFFWLVQGPLKSGTMLALSLITLAIYYLYLFCMPCECGRPPVLTAKSRVAVRKRLSPNCTKLELRNMSIQMIIGIVLIFTFVPIAEDHGFTWLVSLFINAGYILSFAAGLVFFLGGLFDLLEPLRLNTCIKRFELENYGVENGQNSCGCDQDKLLSLLLQVGNFEDADKLSKTLFDKDPELLLPRSKRIIY